MKKFKQSFAAQLSVFVALLATLIFLSAFGTTFYYARKKIMEGAEGKALCHLDNTVLRMSNILNSVEIATTNMLPFVLRNIEKPDSMFAYSRLILQSNPYIIGCSISFEPYYYKSRGKYFSAYSCVKDGAIVTEQEGSETYQYQYMDWYQIPKLLNRPYWSDPYIDLPDASSDIVVDEQMCTYSVPFDDKYGNFVGVISVDISMKWLSHLVSTLRPYKNSHTIALGRGGVYLVHPDTAMLVKHTIFTETLENDVPQIVELGKAMVEGKRGMMKLTGENVRGGEDSYVFFTPFKRVGWSVALVCPKSDVFADYNGLKILLIYILAIGILMMMVVCILVIQRRLKPLEKLAKSANVIAKGNFTQEIPIINSDDEIGSLSRAFRDMQHSLENYIEELKATTAKKERIEGELQIAHDIQMGMIPKIFPTIPEYEDIDAFALLKPAKEVGGDLYDFIFIGKKFYFVVGDVSGKGVPASLIMAVCRNLFRTVACKELLPAQIVSSINDILSEGNDSGMFVTLFVGVIDLQTGKMKYCNAGHNPPVVVEKEGKAKFMQVQSNIPAGLFEGYDYVEEEMETVNNKLLFVYSDGLTEAEDNEQRMYGEEKLIEELSGKESLMARDVVQGIEQSVASHADGAAQSDDLTMMAIKIKVNK